MVGVLADSFSILQDQARCSATVQMEAQSLGLQQLRNLNEVHKTPAAYHILGSLAWCFFNLSCIAWHLIVLA